MDSLSKHCKVILLRNDETFWDSFLHSTRIFSESTINNLNFAEVAAVFQQNVKDHSNQGMISKASLLTAWIRTIIASHITYQHKFSSPFDQGITGIKETIVLTLYRIVGTVKKKSSDFTINCILSQLESELVLMKSLLSRRIVYSN